MLSACMEVLGLALSVAGSLLVTVACGLPTWKVTAFIESNILVAQVIMDGLWMSCVSQSTGQLQCKVYDSVLGLAQELQTARALAVVSAVLCVLALTVTVTGARCTVCIREDALKARVVAAGGALFLVSGLAALVPACLMANSIIVDFHDPRVPASQKREIGAAIYVGWAGAALLLLGGALLCGSRLRGARTGYPIMSAPIKTLTSAGDFDKKLYV